MAGSYKKPSTKSPSPRAKASGMAKFPHASAPRLSPLKTKIYTKASLAEDPTAFGGFGFGDTGLVETPSIIGMRKNAR